KPLWCFYDHEGPERPWPYTPKDVPFTYCTALVYCCLGLSEDGRNITSLRPEIDFGEHGLRQFSWLKSHARGLKVYLVLGGHETNSARFAPAVEDSQYARVDLLLNTHHWLDAFDYDGIVLQIMEPESFAVTDSSINEFVLAMHGSLKERRKDFSVILPPEASRRNTYFSPLVYARQMDLLVQWSHNLVEKPVKATCPSPLHGDDDEKALSVEGILESVKSSYLEEQAEAVLSKLMLSFSFVGFSYELTNSSRKHLNHPHAPLPRPVLIRTAQPVAYHQICKASTAWNTTYNQVTGCLELVGKDSFVSYPGRPPRELLKRTAGAALFNMDMDDFQGLCGKKNSLTRTFASFLNLV
ncbi:unnamed protein product, partial [Ixodes pacificus]